jgi:hypothetical protein
MINSLRIFGTRWVKSPSATILISMTRRKLFDS